MVYRPHPHRAPARRERGILNADRHARKRQRLRLA